MRVAAPSPSTRYTCGRKPLCKGTPSIAAINRSNSAASKPGSTSMQRPAASRTRKGPPRSMLPVCIAPTRAPRFATISTGTISCADPATRLRHASSVCTLSPCAAENSLRPNPLCSNSQTRRSTSARLRRRFPVITPFAFIHQLQHRSKANERMGLPERLRKSTIASRVSRRSLPISCGVAELRTIRSLFLGNVIVSNGWRAAGAV
jgi:hypothetical protein